MKNDDLPKLDGISLLLIDDDPGIIRSLGRALRGLGATVRSAASIKEAKLALAGFRPDVILSDLQLKDGQGLQLVSDYLSHVPSGHFYLITGYGSVENAVESIKLGVKDYLQKPVDPIELAQRLLDDRSGSAESKPHAIPYLLYQDPLMEQALAELPRIASSLQTVLIQGESGTGKELVARAIHELSLVADGPFVALNCGAIPESLLEDELFGHEKGAFTGAQKIRKGHFEQADGGTLFLDEIGEMPLPFQVRLLRVLEENAIKRVGSEQSVPVNVRIIAATHRNLEKEVSSGLFRQDLYYRLNILMIQLPPLRLRPADVQLLAKHFLQRSLQDLQHPSPSPTLDESSLGLLTSYQWPGNVRELRNMMTRLAVRLPAEIKSIDAQWINQLLPQHVQTVHSGHGCVIPKGSTLAEAEQILIHAALADSSGNRIQAAKTLGIGERTLRRKLNNC
ncbi:MAG TPA: sigma-54-dependent Fis family transcriptional regulator [Crenotrichaceae bacterium]|nr:sigma-54-dependent Fis family transcriptional regulator [Crenotrichaceae bacterium]